MKFKRKVESWQWFIIGFIGLLFIGSLYGYATTKIADYMSSLIILAVVLVVALPSYILGSYEIVDDMLIIKKIFGINKKIDINSIKTVTVTYNPINNKVVEKHRMAIYYKTTKKSAITNVTPQNGQEFVNALKKVNKAIVVTGK